MDIYICTDLDGVIVHYPTHGHVDWRAKAALMNWLARQVKDNKSFYFSFVTNRAAGEGILPFVWDYHAYPQIHLCESGETVYFMTEDRRYWTMIVPSLQEFADETRPEILARLREKVGLGKGDLQEHGQGHHLVSIHLVAKDPNRIPSLRQRVEEALVDYDLRYEGRSLIIIHPACWSKGKGFLYFLELYQQMFDQAYPITEALWVADGKRDIEIARLFAERGGTVASVGNADQAYKEVVVNCPRNITTDRPHEAGLQDILRRFTRKIK